MRNKLAIAAIALFLFWAGDLWAGLHPETGAWNFQRYSPRQYRASPQNWAIAEAPNGVMYFGNNEGLLEFDGTTWTLLQLPNHSAVRSLAIDALGQTYVGGSAYSARWQMTARVASGSFHCWTVSLRMIANSGTSGESCHQKKELISVVIKEFFYCSPMERSGSGAPEQRSVMLFSWTTIYIVQPMKTGWCASGLMESKNYPAGRISNVGV